MPTALLSVSNKTGIVELGRALSDRGWTLLSTGGTARALRDAEVAVTEVSDVTGHPEILDGRVKTLHPAIHSGLLARPRHEGDERQMAELGYGRIDMLVANLYPFRETIADPKASFADAIENIDIGGPAMLRAAAKNHEAVWVVVEPSDYERVLAAIDRDDPALRRELAARAFAHTSRYDGAIEAYLTQMAATDEVRRTPARIQLSLTLERELRYGENPDQSAAFYAEAGAAHGIPAMEQLHGKELSFNNLLDVDGALFAISPWVVDGVAACAIIKHTTPCGLAVGDDVAEAYRKALDTDPTSAFGSVIAFSAPVTEQAALLMRPNFIEAIVAPAFVPRALEILREKKNLRILTIPAAAASTELDYKRVRGGFLVQERMRPEFPEDGWRVVTRREPDEDEMNDLRFAWRAVASVKSNAILLARGGSTVGIGAGQMSRVDSSRIAVMKARDNGHNLAGAVLASDAFFPFRDGVDAAADAGVRAIIQPGGSVRDEEVINAADEHGIAMVFTGRRLFRH